MNNLQELTLELLPELEKLVQLDETKDERNVILVWVQFELQLN